MKIKLSGNLARFVDYKRELDIDVGAAGTLKQAIAKMVDQYPALKDIVQDKNAQIKKGYLISLNGEKVDVNGADKKVSDSDSLDIFTAIAGG